MKLAYTQADLDAIKTAIAQGSKKVQYKDRSVEYHSLAELRSIAKEIEEELAGGTKRRRIAYPVHSKGLHGHGRD